MALSFNKTETAFRAQSNKDLFRSKLLFNAINYPFIVKIGQVLLPILSCIPFLRQLVKQTLFNQFVGGETIQDCTKTINFLFNEFKIGSMLDFAIEGKNNNEHFDLACAQIIQSINFAKQKEAIPFAVFKFSAIGSHLILEKKQQGIHLSKIEETDYHLIIGRAFSIAKFGAENNVPVFIDAEESWIQSSINEISLTLMKEFNQQSPMVFTTVQCYLKNSNQWIKELHTEAINKNFMLGIKLVRGAYLDKEKVRAAQFHSTNPIHTSKAGTDQSYNDALQFSIDHIDEISLCSATHNEKSAYYLAELISKKGLEKNDPRIFSAQLYGMGNHISFNLIKENYNVVKYMPYGPLKEVIPYLLRRAHENKSIQGQVSRELALINLEIKRRKQKKED